MLATYNGGALTLGRELSAALDDGIAVIFGGVLNEDDGGPLPVDARPGLTALGIALRRRDRAARAGARGGHDGLPRRQRGEQRLRREVLRGAADVVGR